MSCVRIRRTCHCVGRSSMCDHAALSVLTTGTAPATPFFVAEACACDDTVCNRGAVKMQGFEFDPQTNALHLDLTGKSVGTVKLSPGNRGDRLKPATGTP